MKTEWQKMKETLKRIDAAKTAVVCPALNADVSSMSQIVHFILYHPDDTHTFDCRGADFDEYRAMFPYPIYWIEITPKFAFIVDKVNDNGEPVRCLRTLRPLIDEHNHVTFPCVPEGTPMDDMGE
jgi:hypothetical protein